MKKITRDISPAKVNSQIEKEIEREMDNENSAMLATSSPRFFSDDEEGNDHLLTLNLGPVGTRRDSLTATSEDDLWIFVGKISNTHAVNNDNKSNFIACYHRLTPPRFSKKSRRRNSSRQQNRASPLLGALGRLLYEIFGKG